MMLKYGYVILFTPPPKKVKNDEFLGIFKNMTLNIARAFARARLKIFLIESLIDFEHFWF